MGDAFTTREVPAFEVRVIGTGPIERIDVLRDSKVVDTLKPDGGEYKGTWKDPRPAQGRHYYYVRVLQKDQQLAWGSPLWVEYTR